MPGFFRFERRFSLPRSSWPTQQPCTSCSARQAFHFDYFPWWDIHLSFDEIDPQFRSSLTHSARCASVWLSLRGKRWWATWTNMTLVPRTSTAHSTRTLQRWELKNKKISQHRISKSNCQVNIISMAKDFSTYFSRIYPVASNDQEVLISLCLDGTLLFLLWCLIHHQNTRWPPVVVDHCYNCYNFM